jgi:Putative Flp pilus-assembly TadE/G-like
MRSLTPRAIHRREDGAVAVLVALMLVVFVAMVAIAVDAGGLYLRRRELVTGSDSAAMSAGRTCARGGFDDRFTNPEDAADFHVQENGLITALEVGGPTPNITSITPCGLQWGHVTVEYTSEQSLFFAPALGFESAKPVTTTATASWGLGSNNPVPMVISSLSSASCPVPPNGSPSIGQICAFWYDNDRFEGGNFGFLSLNPAGWDVPIDDNCSGSVSGGTDSLTAWIDGSLPASVSLNWTDPTYVCTETGIKGVGGKGGVNSKLWRALEDLEGEIRDFPINWEGPGAPVPDAPAQGTVYFDGNPDQIDKYDIIGFAFLRIVDVLGRDEAAGGVGTCETPPGNTWFSWTAPDQVLDLTTVSNGPSWQGCSPTVPSDIFDETVSVTAKNNDADCCTPCAPSPTPGCDWAWDANTSTITWKGTVPKDTKVSFDWWVDPNSGPCGVKPDNASAVCVVTEWQGSTLDDTFVPTDKNTVIRLCDFAYGTCLDQ